MFNKTSATVEVNSCNTRNNRRVCDSANHTEQANCTPKYSKVTFTQSRKNSWGTVGDNWNDTRIYEGQNNCLWEVERPKSSNIMGKSNYFRGYRVNMG